jgi:exo-beta-1,3-glucanase (GH17 family)
MCFAIAGVGECNQARVVLAAAMRLNMTVMVGRWLNANNTTNQQELEAFKRLINTAPPAHIAQIYAVAVGNEVLYRLRWKSS